MPKRKKILNLNIPLLARVEGEGALDLVIENQTITTLNLRIFEPPRYFEKFMEGRKYSEILDIVARICGICPVAYQMTAVQALEQIFEMQISPWVRAMRRVFYCGEWIQSHCLHMHLLAIPDYLGFESALKMAKQFPAEVKRGLALQNLGNELITLFGARAVHPVGAKIGGFSQSPSRAAVELILEKLKKHLPLAEELIAWTTQLPIPSYQHPLTLVALHHDEEYAMNEGEIISNNGLRISKENYQSYFHEFQQPYSTALHSLLNKEPYLVGPLARVTLNFQQLPSSLKAILKQHHISFEKPSMFQSTTARAIEVYFAISESIRILENFVESEISYNNPIIQAGVGFGATEAPRGLLWQAYAVNATGQITKANIIPPTSQNQAQIEQDLSKTLMQYGLDKSDQELKLMSEMVIRNYDPCISCSTHFLDLRVKRQ